MPKAKRVSTTQRTPAPEFHQPMFPPRKPLAEPAAVARSAVTTPSYKGPSAVPSAARPVRALTLIDSLSPGCMTFRIPDKASSPHLRPGEYAVVDLSDRSPQHGELFLIQSNCGERPRYIQQSTRTWTTTSSSGIPEKVWWLRDLAGWRQEGTDGAGIPIFSGMSDGPMKKKGLKKIIAGRIVGYAESDLGNELEQNAGYAE